MSEVHFGVYVMTMVTACGDGDGDDDDDHHHHRFRRLIRSSPCSSKETFHGIPRCVPSDSGVGS